MAGDTVKIIFDAVDNASAKTQSMLGKIQQGFSAFNNVMYAAGQAARVAQQIIDETVAVTVDYANEVRTLQMASGQTAEETSRMVQVFDDFKISAENLTPAIRKMTSEGLTPNLATMAALSDEYRALQDPLAKNAFLMDKFGRAGLGMAEIMSKGGDAILAMGAAVDESLILTQQGVDQAREYEIALDNWNDAIEGVKISIGTKLIPVMTDLMNQMADGTRTQEILIEKYGLLGNQTDERVASARAQAVVEREAAQAMMESADAAKTEGDALGDLSEQAASMSAGEQLNFVLSFQAKSDDFEQSRDDLLAKMRDTRDKILAIQEEMAAGTIRQSEGKSQIAELGAEMSGFTDELNDNEAAWKQWQKQTAFSLMSTQALAKGASFEDVMKMGEDFGVIDPEVVAQATAMMDAVSGVETTGLDQAVSDIKYLIQQDGRTIRLYVEQTTTTVGGGQMPTTTGMTTTESGGDMFIFNNATMYLGQWAAQDILAAYR